MVNLLLLNIIGYLVLYEGHSKVFESTRPIESMAVGNPDVLQTRVLSYNQVLLNALSEGVTNLIITTDKGPQELEVIIEKRDPLEFYSPKIIRTDVWILEVERNQNLEWGIDWLKQIGFKENPIPETFPLDMGPIKRIDNLSATLRFLEEKGVVKILSQPSLVALEKSESEFHSGGEIPFVVSAAYGMTQIEWKEYGVKLNVQAFVDNEGFIKLTIQPEVSDLDYANAVVVNGLTYPAIKKSTSKVEVKLLPGQSILISGLAKKTLQSQRSGIPILSRIPFFGSLLFARHLDNYVSKEIVFIVTPRILPTSPTTGRLWIYKRDKTQMVNIPLMRLNEEVYFPLEEPVLSHLKISKDWIEKGKLLRIRVGGVLGGLETFLSIETSTLLLDGTAVNIIPPVRIYDGKVFVPFSFFQKLGLEILWDGLTGDMFLLREFGEKP